MRGDPRGDGLRPHGVGAGPYGREWRFLRVRMWAEERVHERLTSRWGRQWYGPRPRRFLPYAATVWGDLVAGAHLAPPYRFAYAFGTIHWNEINGMKPAGLPA